MAKMTKQKSYKWIWKYLFFVAGTALFWQFTQEYEGGKHQRPLWFLYAAVYLFAGAWSMYRIDRINIIGNRVAKVLKSKNKHRGR